MTEPGNKSDFENIEQVMKEAEERFRQGLRFLNDWSTQAKEMIERQPGTVLAGVALLGFLTGLALRHTMTDSSGDAKIHPLRSPRTNIV
jgi:hypothetical protein